MRTMPVSAMPISAMTSVDIRAGTPTYMDYNTLAKDIYETAKREKWPQQKLTHMLNNPKDFQKIVKKVTHSPFFNLCHSANAILQSDQRN